MTEIAIVDWFGRWETSVFSENTAIFLLNGLVHLYQLDESISNFRGVWCSFLFLFYSKQKFL